MKILALCDSPTLTTGFGRVAQNLFRQWNRMGAVIDCWAIAFKGWHYREVPYVRELFPAGVGGEWSLPQNLNCFIAQLQRGGYTHLWMMQDTFLLSPNKMPEAVEEVCTKLGIVSCLYFPVDAPLEPEWTKIIQAVDIPVAYTRYGKEEAMKAIDAFRAEDDPKRRDWLRGPFTREIAVLPHGMDTKLYKPLPDRQKVRETFWQNWKLSPEELLMVNVNANQRRKDVTRSLEVLKALKGLGVPARLVMHMPECSAEGTSLETVGRQLGLVVDTDWGHHDDLFNGSISKLPEADLVRLYNAADLYLTTTLGEGWGLGLTEALACGCPVAMPNHTSCREIAVGLQSRGWNGRCVLLPTEPNAVVMERDNSRRRFRTDVERAADLIATGWKEGWFKKREAPPQDVSDWLSWGRVAREFLRLMKGVKKEPAKKAPSKEAEAMKEEVPA